LYGLKDSGNPNRGLISRIEPKLNLAILRDAQSFSQFHPTRRDSQSKVVQVLSDPHTGKALVFANQSRNVRSNIKRSVNSAVRAAYRSLAAFFIDLRPK